MEVVRCEGEEQGADSGVMASGMDCGIPHCVRTVGLMAVRLSLSRTTTEKKHAKFNPL
jgi:hypothetical protein